MREHVAAHAVAVERAQGAVAALGRVELAARIAVVDEQQRAGLQAAGHRLQPVRQLRQQFGAIRSEEHTSELQSLMRISYAVFCLKKQTQNYKTRKTDM